MSADRRGAIAVLGTGLAGLGHAGGLTEQEIIAQAACKAVARSGLEMKDIDGILTSSLTSPWWVMRMAEYLGIRPRFSDSTMFGGSSFIADLKVAALAIAAGECENVLVCYGSTPRSAPSSSKINQMRAELDPQPYEHPYKPFNPVSSYALAAARHMHQYGTTRRQLAEVAVAARQWAQRNADAFARGPLTIDDVLGAKMISDPLTVRDCCLVTDGAGAFVLTSAARARTLHAKPVYVLGSGHAHWHRQISCMEDLTVTPAVDSGRSAFAQAGLTPADIDHVNAHATSTPDGDTAELQAIRDILGEEHAAEVPITASKSMLGHTLGAAGAIEAAITILALRDGCVPPTINLHDPDDAGEGLNLTPNVAQRHALRIGLSNSFGFGGQNTALIFRRWDA